MKTLLLAINAAAQALSEPEVGLSFTVDPGAARGATTSFSHQTLSATFAQLCAAFGEPFFDVVANPMETPFDSSAEWSFSDSDGGIYTVYDYDGLPDKVDGVAEIRDSGRPQIWNIGASRGSDASSFCDWAQTKLKQE